MPCEKASPFYLRGFSFSTFPFFLHIPAAAMRLLSISPPPLLFSPTEPKHLLAVTACHGHLHSSTEGWIASLYFPKGKVVTCIHHTDDGGGGKVQ